MVHCNAGKLLKEMHQVKAPLRWFVATTIGIPTVSWKIQVFEEALFLSLYDAGNEISLLVHRIPKDPYLEFLGVIVIQAWSHSMPML